MTTQNSKKVDKQFFSLLLCPCKQVFASGLIISKIQNCSKLCSNPCPPESLEKIGSFALKLCACPSLQLCNLQLGFRFLLLIVTPTQQSSHSLLVLFFKYQTQEKDLAFFFRPYSELVNFKNITYLKVNAYNQYFIYGCYYINLIHEYKTVKRKI